jgi:hypothetical protein
MAYTISATLFLGAGNTGLTLTAALFDSANSAAAGLTTTTLVETDAGTGIYLWTGTVPDGHRGLIKFSSGGVVKTAVSVNAQEIENPDVKTSTVAALSATAVWAAGTRTLTSFGTLVADIAAAVSAAASSAAAIAAAVWAYAARTLTITAAQLAAVVAGTDLTLHRGDTWTISLTGLGNISTRTKLWFTVKNSRRQTDAQAVLQIEETAGLLIVNGAVAGTAAHGAITVTDATLGNITITLDEAESALVVPGDSYSWDMQMRTTAGAILTLTQGSAAIEADVTRAVA